MGNAGMLQKWAIEMERFCAYQERSEYEVRVKLAKRGASDADINTVLSKLIEQNFLQAQERNQSKTPEGPSLDGKNNPRISCT